VRLSLIIPAYNERQTLGRILVLASRALPDVEKEFVVVDDCSTDGTREWLQANVPAAEFRAAAFMLDPQGALRSDPDACGAGSSVVVVVYHPQNRGKGAAIRSGLDRVGGDVVVIQDADLEYDPVDLGPMFELIARRGIADVVFGSRFYGKPHRSLNFHHYLANRTISLAFNVLYNQTLTDVECCYKMMTTAIARSLLLSANDFGIEIEIGAGVARRGRLRIYEIGISYYGRSYDEGKKIGWRDGLKAFWYLLKYRVRPLPRTDGLAGLPAPG
jgi:glycosyltransferase involved in cell wall biosynthesis